MCDLHPPTIKVGLQRKMGDDSGRISESRHEERLLRVKRSEKEHIFALTGETPSEQSEGCGSPRALQKASPSCSGNPKLNPNSLSLFALNLFDTTSKFQY